MKHTKNPTKMLSAVYTSLLGCALLCGVGQTVAAQQTQPANIRLNVAGNYLLGNWDWMSSTNPNEVTFTQFLQTMYMPTDALTGTRPLYRLYSNAAYDHMDSTVPTEGSYSADYILGFLPTSPMPGMTAVHRFRQPHTGDHLTTFAGYPGTADHLDEGIMGYAFARYPNSGETLLNLQGNRVRIGANMVAGGAISELWFNGKQFINDWDFGRQLQCALYSGFDWPSVDNPTEAGDNHGWPQRRIINGKPQDVDPNRAHGSPLVFANVNTTTKTLQTACFPLQWNPESYSGGLNNPVMSTTMLTKEVQADFQGQSNVVRWKIHLDVTQPAIVFATELATAYLVADFRSFYTYCTRTGALTTLQLNLNDGKETLNREAGDTAIVATPTGSYALGIYYPRALLNQGWTSNLTGFAFYSFLAYDDPAKQEADKKYNGNATKASLILRSSQGITVGPHDYTTYILVGTLTDVTQSAKWLYSHGY